MSSMIMPMARRPRAAGELEVERLLHVAVVKEPRERVEDGLAPQRVAQPQVGERQCDALGHGHRKPLAGFAPRLERAIRLIRFECAALQVQEAQRLAMRHRGNAEVARRVTSYPAGKVITLTATAAWGSFFSGW